MRFVVPTAILSSVFCLYAQTGPQASSVPDAKPIPPRASPNDYQAHAKAGSVTIGAEFNAHFVPTPGGTYTTEDFVVVEAGVYGDPDANLALSPDQFSLHINDGKKTIPSQSVVLVITSLKDPEWTPPEQPGSKSGGKTSLTGGGGGGGGNEPPPPPPHMPPELQHAMIQRVQKAVLAEGDRPLPQAGLLFFPYRGQTKGIRSIELIYKGPAGTVTLPLHP